MENSGEIMHRGGGDAAGAGPQWYLANGANPLGPFRATEIGERLQAGALPWITYAWRAGMNQWERLCDLADFQSVAPGRPAAPPSPVSGPASAAVDSLKKRGGVKETGKQVPRSTSEAPAPSRWFLFYNDAQYGPFTTDEVQRFLKIGKLHGRVHAWSESLSTWTRLEKIPAFQEAVAASALARQSKRASSEPPASAVQSSEQRESPRKPLIARTLHATDKEVSSGMCRDVSVGGMQVLTDSIPGSVGTALKLNIRPMENNLPAFVAEGVIVRILEDHRGFCFRFTQLSTEGKKTLEKHLAEGGI